MEGYQKYKRQYYMPPTDCMDWTKKEYIEKAPTWCSVDLRDGNQALIVPMSLDEKLDFFELLVEIGFKEIEIGFPAASQTEFEFLRKLIDENRIPEDVTIQVLTQAREHIIRRTFEAVKGAKNAVIHLYNSTSYAQREQVFKKSKEEVLKIAVEGAKLLKQLTEEDSGEYEGIGISVAKDTDTGYAEIVSVFKDQPAYKAGLKTGDLIIAVNKKSTMNMELQEVVSEIKKKENKKVVLTIYRDKKSKDYTVKKSSVQLDTVSYKMKEKKIGYIAVSQFLENTGDQFDKAVTALEKKGMRSLIIDLRDNGGGLLNTCTQMVSRVIDKDKLIVYTKDKEGNKEEFKSDSGKTLDIPIIILVNGNTASASEIMTGCLKDYGKATVVGTTTYGKGIVQNIMPLTDGSAIKFTIAKYYTPNGTDIHKKGIKPDVKVKMSDAQWKKAQTDEKADKQLKKAIELLEK